MSVIIYGNLPVPGKAWQISPNNIVGKQTTHDLQNAAVFIAKKNLLTGFGLAPFTVRGSSDSVTAALDGADRLVDPADIVPSNGAHSWIVLRQAATGIEICYDFFYAAGVYLHDVVYSPADGFTGGSTTSRPTATDEQVRSALNWNAGGTANTTFRMHAWHAEDGTATAVVVMNNGHVVHMMLAGQADDPVTGWTLPFYFLDHGSGNAGDSANLSDVTTFYANDRICGRAPAGNMTMYMSMEGCSGTQLGAITPLSNAMRFNASSNHNLHPVQSIGLVSLTVGARGRHGVIPDFWRAPSSLNGYVFRDEAGTQLVSFDGWTFSWSEDLPPPLPF